MIRQGNLSKAAKRLRQTVSQMRAATAEYLDPTNSESIIRATNQPRLEPAEAFTPDSPRSDLSLGPEEGGLLGTVLSTISACPPDEVRQSSLPDECSLELGRSNSFILNEEDKPHRALRSHSFQPVTTRPVAPNAQQVLHSQDVIADTSAGPQEELIQGSTVMALRQLKIKTTLVKAKRHLALDELQEDNEVAELTGHFAGPAIALKRRWPAPRDVASIATEADRDRPGPRGRRVTFMFPVQSELRPSSPVYEREESTFSPLA